MLLTLRLLRLHEYMTTAFIETVYAAEGTLLAPATKLLDFKVDLSAFAAHDCPPISFYRIALREPAWLRKLVVAAGEEIRIGAALAQLSTAPDEALDGAPLRAVRVTIAGILPP